MPVVKQWKCRVQVVGNATMDAVILPPRQADQPIPALTLPRLQHIEWSEKANEVNFVLCRLGP